MYDYVCIYMYIHVYTCIYMFVHRMYIYIYIYAHVFGVKPQYVTGIPTKNDQLWNKPMVPDIWKIS